ncbi:MAG: hypothetical protein ACO294_07550 [Methylococcales bacterium]
MASTSERVGILETKVVHIDEKIDELKVDVKDMHDCLDRTRDCLMTELKSMSEKSTNAHSELASKISSLEKDKNKIVFLFAGGVAAFGWITGHIELLIKLFT